ncbi:MAG: putative salt-induced outer membrane protein [Moritella sp.]|jgi:putative salt-induced outer membrane protein
MTMKKMLVASAIFMAALFSTQVSAQADAELGATLTSGNTDTTSVKARLDMKHNLG